MECDNEKLTFVWPVRLFHHEIYRASHRDIVQNVDGAAAENRDGGWSLRNTDSLEQEMGEPFRHDGVAKHDEDRGRVGQMCLSRLSRSRKGLRSRSLIHLSTSYLAVTAQRPHSAYHSESPSYLIL